MPSVRSAVPGIVWPAITEPVAASLLAALHQLDAAQWWPAPRRAAQQLEQLRVLFAHARRTVPWYADHPRIDIDGLDSWEAFARLPLLGRADVQAAPDALRSTAVPREHGALIPYATSGSLGTPLRGVETELSHFFWNVLNLREHLWQKRDFSRRFAAIRTRVTRQTLDDWGDPVARVFHTGDAVTLDIATPVEAQIAWLRQERPDYLLTHPSNLRAIALALAAADETLPLTGIGTFGEALPEATRALCRQRFHCEIADIYSSEEIGYLALQCEMRRGYHVMAENLIVEILDASGRPCTAGETGRVVVTPLHNFAMPLIRYELGDHAQVGHPCPCGRGLPVLGAVRGRTRNMLRRADGDWHWPSFPGELWLSAAPLRQIQLRQRRLDLIVVRYTAERELSASETGDLRHRLAASLQFDGALRFERVAALPPGPGGKYEDFVCEVTD